MAEQINLIELDLAGITKQTEELTDRIYDLSQANVELKKQTKLSAEELEKQGTTINDVNKQLYENDSELKKLKSTRDSNNKLLKTEINSISQLKERNSQLKKELENVNTTTKEGKKRIKEITDEIDKNKIAIDSATGGHKSFGATIKGGVSSVMAWTAAVGVSIAGIKEFGEKIINATGDAQDLAEVLKNQAKAAMDVFFKSMATGNFDNFISKTKEAIKLAKEYADSKDRLTDLTRSLEVQESKAQIRIEELELVYKSSNNTLEERRNAILEINKIEGELAAKRKQYAQENLDSDVKMLSSTTGLKESEIKNFVEKYENYDKLISKGKEFKAEFDKQMTGVLATDNNIKEALNATTQKLGKSYMLAYAMTSKYGNATEEEYNNIKNGIVAVNESQSNYLQSTERGNVRLAGFEKNIQAEKAKTVKATEDQTEAERVRFDEINIKMIESGEIRIENEEDVAGKLLQINEDRIKKELEEEEKALEEKRKRQEEHLAMSEYASEAFFVSIEAIRDTAYQGEVDAAEGNEKKIAEINKKYNQKAKRAAIAEALVNGALAIIRAFKDTAFPLSVGVAAVIAATTAANIAKIRRTEYYAKGGEVKTGRFTGPSHNSGGINLYTEKGQHVAQVEGGEGFYVVNKHDNPEAISALSNINKKHGVDFSTPVRYAAQGGEISTTGLDKNALIEAIKSLNIVVSVVDIADGLSKQAKVVKISEF